MDKLLYSITEAGGLIGRGKSTAYAMVAAGELETVVVGSQRMVPAAALHALVERLRSEAKTGGSHRLLELVDEKGRIDVSRIPADATLADLAEAKRIVAGRHGISDEAG